ncbi:hypothetical protein [Sphingomonas sabuli]|uniref:hypothetical protein n=1 Tax=Sphingomonas sabuli TaxID=2764186 RepID=UPI001FE48CD1|nr:hypothetical protein [Sphingomonas sabuli]
MMTVQGASGESFHTVAPDDAQKSLPIDGLRHREIAGIGRADEVGPAAIDGKLKLWRDHSGLCVAQPQQVATAA